MVQSKIAEDPTIRTLAAEWADLESIKQDLQFVSAAAARLDLIGDEDTDSIVRRALWASAVVAYRRCFTSGRGYGLMNRQRLKIPKSTIDLLDAELQATSAAAREMADRHVAHRVKEEWSQSPVHLLFDESNPDAPTYVGLTILSAVLIGPAAEEPPRLRALADQLIVVIESMAADKQAALASRVNEMLAEL
jgi:hypothetical protein